MKGDSEATVFSQVCQVDSLSTEGKVISEQRSRGTRLSPRRSFEIKDDDIYLIKKK